MFQSVLTGKAAEVFLSLTSEQQKDYQTVKDVIQRSYAMVLNSTENHLGNLRGNKDKLTLNLSGKKNDT